jgi:hypothetical protein
VLAVAVLMVLALASLARSNHITDQMTDHCWPPHRQGARQG